MENVAAAKTIRKRLETVRSCPGPEGCVSCDCYHLLLFYLMEELAKYDSPEARDLLENISKEFKDRKKLKLHGCRGCSPCYPAEWAAELAKKR